MTLEDFVIGWGRLLGSYPMATNARSDLTQLAYYSAFGGLKRCAWERLVEEVRKTIDEVFPTVAQMRLFVNEDHECDACHQGPKRIPSGAVRLDDRFWTSPEQARLLMAVVRDNPKHEGEGSLSYIERLAITAGLVAKPIMSRGWDLDAPETAARVVVLREQAEKIVREGG